MFLGCCFAGTSSSFDYKGVPAENIDTITLKNAIYDEMYITSDTNGDFDGCIHETWDWNTHLHPTFD